MIKSGLVVLFAAAAMAQPVPFSGLGPQRISAARGGLRSGITVEFATYAIPGGDWATAYAGGGISGGGDTLHRGFGGPGSGAQFGYDLAFSGDAASGYQAVFRPSTIDGALLADPDRFPPPQPVRDGDTIALDIMVSPDGTRRIVDYIRVSLHPLEPPAATTTAAPRDFTVDDGAVTYDVSATSVWIAGKKQGGIGGFTGKPGGTFWIAFPGQGRYILSLVPHTGMAKSGVVRDNMLFFQDGDEQYEVRFMTPVAGRGKAWNLYVMHDGAYEPRTHDAVSAGVDRLENLLPGQ